MCRGGPATGPDRRRHQHRLSARALQIIEQLPEAPASVPLPLREAQTLAMELLMRQALDGGLELTILDSPAYRRYAAQRNT